MRHDIGGFGVDAERYRNCLGAPVAAQIGDELGQRTGCLTCRRCRRIGGLGTDARPIRSMGGFATGCPARPHAASRRAHGNPSPSPRASGSGSFRCDEQSVDPVPGSVPNPGVPPTSRLTGCRPESASARPEVPRMVPEFPGEIALRCAASPRKSGGAKRSTPSRARCMGQRTRKRRARSQPVPMLLKESVAHVDQKDRFLTRIDVSAQSSKAGTIGRRSRNRTSRRIIRIRLPQHP